MVISAPRSKAAASMSVGVMARGDVLITSRGAILSRVFIGYSFTELLAHPAMALVVCLVDQMLARPVMLDCALILEIEPLDNGRLLRKVRLRVATLEIPRKPARQAHQKLLNFVLRSSRSGSS